MKPFTIEYSQPTEYRFSLDSIETPFAVANWVASSKHPVTRVLDLCAGCGVMGLELAFHLPRDLQIDFVEIQPVYQAHFAKNIDSMRVADRKREVSRKLDWRWLEMNYEQLAMPEFQDRYDLILANPPYFESSQGVLSPNEFKNRCRFFVDSSAEKLWDALGYVLAPGGSAFVLLRSQENHGSQVFKQLQMRLRYQAHTEVWKSIRGTDLVRIWKDSFTPLSQ